MITSIETTYKNLDIHLKNLGDINYFIGKNGSGKTRLFNALSEYIGGQSKLTKITGIDSYSYIANNPTELNSLMIQDLKKFQVVDEKNPSNKRRLALGCSENFKKDSTTKKILEIFELQNFYFDMNSLENSEYSLDNCIIFYKDETKKEPCFWLDDCSSGFQSLFKTWNNIYHQTLENISGKSIFYSFTFDEGDRHLHPSLAKFLPRNLELIKKGIEDLLKQKGATEVSVQFFISTHSPFLISALGDNELKMSHKVYMLKEGKTIEPRGRGVNTEKSNSGYSSEEVLVAVNEMLGIELNDLTPEMFILAEESIHVLLKSFAQKINEECKYFEYTTKGDSDTIKKGLSLLEQRKAIPFLNSRIYVIFDGKSDVNQKEKRQLEDGLIDDFMYVKDDSVKDLESCYPENIVKDFTESENWGTWNKSDHETFKKFLNSKKITDHSEQGEIKSKLAKYIVTQSDEKTLRSHLPVLDKIFPKK
jgi:hypothetical protein